MRVIPLAADPPYICKYLYTLLISGIFVDNQIPIEEDSGYFYISSANDSRVIRRVSDACDWLYASVGGDNSRSWEQFAIDTVIMAAAAEIAEFGEDYSGDMVIPPDAEVASAPEVVSSVVGDLIPTCID